MKKIYRRIVLSLMLIFGISGCAGVNPSSGGYNVAIPLHVINSTVGQSFPQKQKTNYGTLMIDKPNILGKQGSDKLGLGTAFSFSNMLIPDGIKGSISISSGVRFNPSDKGLYLTSPMIDDVKFQNFSLAKYLTPEIRTIIGDIIMQQLANKPIYRMNNIGASFVKGVHIQNGNLIVTLGL